MSEEKKPTDRPVSPPQFQSPPPGSPPTRPTARPQADQARAMFNQAQTVMTSRLGINMDAALKSLALAALTAVLAAVLDRILGLPAGVLAFTFSWIVAALNGMTYSFFKGNTDLSGLIMGAVNGLVTMFVWFIVLEIIGKDVDDIRKISQNAFFVGWFEELNILKAMIAGILVGLLSFGWLAMLRRAAMIKLMR